NWHAPFEPDGDLARTVWRLGRALGEHPDVVRSGVGWILQCAAFVRDVPNIAVARVDLRGGGTDRDLMLSLVLYGRLAADDVPFAPRSDHREVRRQRLVGELEAHLVVSLPRAAVRQTVATGSQRYLDLLLSQQRTRDGGPQQILVLVDAP